MLEENNININYHIDELEEYKKLASKQEEEIIKNKNQISFLINSNYKMKDILSQLNSENNNLKKEINSLAKTNEELIEKNIILEEQINNINMQHKQELDSLINRNDLLINSNSLSNNQIIIFKNAEIESLKHEIVLLKSNKDKLELELDTIKKNFDSKLNKREIGNKKLDEINLGIIERGKDEMNETYQKILFELKERDKIREKEEIAKFEEIIKASNQEKENEIQMKKKVIEDKEELIKENQFLIKNIESIKSNDSLKDFKLNSMQIQIDKIEIQNKKLENGNIFILNENIQLKNEILIN